MTRDESLTIVGMVLNTWPGGTRWTEQEMDAYARGIQHLNAAHATNAVARASRELKYRPSIAELSEFERIERKLAEPEHREQSPTRSTTIPAWVQVWTWLRWTVDDWRLLPQQEGYGYGTNEVSQQEYELLHKQWQDAGSPSMTAQQIARKVGAA